MSKYIFPVTANPSSSFWNNSISNVSSDGSKWVFTGGSAAQISTSASFNANDGIDLNFDIQMPNTSLSGNGIFLNTTDGQFSAFMWYTWDYGSGYLHCDYVEHGTYHRYTSSIASNVRFTGRIIINKDGSGEFYINGSLVFTAPVGTYTGNTFQLYVNKYTESAGYIYSGSIESPLVSFNPSPQMHHQAISGGLM